MRFPIFPRHFIDRGLFFSRLVAELLDKYLTLLLVVRQMLIKFIVPDPRLRNPNRTRSPTRLRLGLGVRIRFRLRFGMRHPLAAKPLQDLVTVDPLRLQFARLGKQRARSRPAAPRRATASPSAKIP